MLNFAELEEIRTERWEDLLAWKDQLGRNTGIMERVSNEPARVTACCCLWLQKEGRRRTVAWGGGAGIRVL